MVSEFAESVYKLVSKVPAGYVTTYKELVIGLGGSGYRAVGRVLNSNPNLVSVPCHRVVCSDASIGGYVGGVRSKETLLQSEGVEVVSGKIVEFEKRLWKFKK